MSVGAVSVGINMFLRDNFSGPAAGVKASSKSLEAQLLSLQAAQLTSTRNLAAGAAIAGVVAIRGMARATKAYADFGYEMNYVGQITKATAQEQNNLSDKAMKLGQDTIFTTQQVADGMRWLAQSGMKYGEVMGNISAAANLAAAAHLDIAGRGGAADILTNIMHAFKISVEDSAYVADVLAESATNANTTVFELGEALKYSASTAMDLNMGLEESAAMVMTLANAGMQASMAGVAMENSMRYLANSISTFASGTQKKALAQMGLSAQDFMDANGNMNSMVQNISVLKKALDGMGNVKSQSILKTIFGVRGKRAGSLLMRNYDEFMMNLKTLEHAQGRAGAIAEDMMDTLKGGILRLGVTWKNVGLKFAEGFAPIVRFTLSIFESLGKMLLKLLSIKYIGPALSAGIAGFIMIKTVSMAYKAILYTINLLQMKASAGAATMAATTVMSYRQMTAAVIAYNRTAAVGQGLSFSAAGGLRNAATGRFVSRAVLGGAAGAAARGAVGASVGIGGVLSKFAGLLGGPWGMALAFILPAAIGGLISVIKGNKRSVEDNTSVQRAGMNQASLNNNTYSAMSHVIEIMEQLAPGFGMAGVTAVDTNIPYNIRRPRVIEHMGAQLLTKDANGNDTVININLDGETIFSERLDAMFNRKSQDTARKLGL